MDGDREDSHLEVLKRETVAKREMGNEAKGEMKSPIYDSES